MLDGRRAEDDDPFFAEHEVKSSCVKDANMNGQQMRVFSFLFADSRINTGAEAYSLFFISSSFVPSRITLISR